MTVHQDMVKMLIDIVPWEGGKHYFQIENTLIFDVLMF